jgi:hypothetical protein
MIPFPVVPNLPMKIGWSEQEPERQSKDEGQLPIYQ